MAGWRATWEIWPALLVCGGSFAVVQFLMANFHGPRLVDVAGGVISMACLAGFLRIWRPRRTWNFTEEFEQEATEKTKRLQVASGQGPVASEENSPSSLATDHWPLATEAAYTRRQIISAWMPWVFLALFVFIWGLPSVKDFLKPAGVLLPMPALHEQIARDRPVVEVRQIEKAIFDFNWLSATGTSLFLAAAISAIWLRAGWRTVLRVFVQTTYQMRWPLFTITCMLAIAFTTRYSGMDATLGIAFTKTGYLYPLFAAMLGWLGVALTGSDTSSNALFGSMQTITARRLVADGILPLSQPQAMILLASANSTGGVMGKMIDAQSIVVAAVATQPRHGEASGSDRRVSASPRLPVSVPEGAILRFVFWHSLALAILMGLLVTAQAYWWTGMIP